MTRITKTITEDLHNSLMRHRFSKDVNAAADRMAHFAKAFRDSLFSDEERSIMNLIPAGWLEKRCQITIKPDGSHSRYWVLNYNGDLSNYVRSNHFLGRRDAEWLPMPQTKTGTQAMSENASLVRDFQEFEFELKTLDKSMTDASQMILSTIGRVSTVKALIQGWPEIEPFASKYLSIPDRKLPALPTHALNGVLGLPVEEDEKEPA